MKPLLQSASKFSSFTNLLLVVAVTWPAARAGVKQQRDLQVVFNNANAWFAEVKKQTAARVSFYRSSIIINRETSSISCQ